jgi:hypothetical protein
VSRLGDDDLRRLAVALATPHAGSDVWLPDENASALAEIEGLKSDLEKKADDEVFGRALTQSLAGYLNRPVRAVAGGSSGVISGAWRYVAKSGPVQWWIEFEAPLAACLADAMLGGSGASAKSGAGRRARMLVAKIADVFLAALSAAVGSPRPLAATWTDEPLHAGDAQLAGRCAVTTEMYAWQAGVSALGKASGAMSPSRPTPPRQEPAASLTSEEAAIAHIRDTIAAACAGLFEIMGCPVVIARPTIEEIDAPEVPEAAIRLALTTGGKGALVVCAQRDAVVAFATGVVGGQVPEADEIGSVVSAAAESVLREIIQRIAIRLGSIAGAPQRTVYIAGDAQLARTQHLSVAVTLHVAGSAANLRVLIPRWMAGAA